MDFRGPPRGHDPAPITRMGYSRAEVATSGHAPTSCRIALTWDAETFDFLVFPPWGIEKVSLVVYPLRV